MLTSSPASRGARAAAFGVWLLAAGSAAYWALQLGGAPQRGAPVAQSARGFAAADPQALARLLGAGGAGAPVALAAAPSGQPARFQLVGVAAGRSGGGVALIAVDGKPARPYRVGTTVDEGLVVQAVQGRRALLGPRAGPPALTLELPAAPALAGVLPRPASGPAAR